MALRPLTDVTRDLPLLNRQLAELEQAIQRVRESQDQIAIAHDKINKQLAKNEATHVNNIDFQWDGPNSKITWTDGFIKSDEGPLYPVRAGEITGLSANTTYWMAFNVAQNVMVASLTAEAVTDVNKPALHLICSLYTGTVVQTGSAGGGGSTWGGGGSAPGDDTVGKSYVLF